jgi:hypothetical protein
MVKHITFSDFVDSFSDTYKNNFSYEGKRALFDYLESYEADTGEPVELDTVALCCDYREYESLTDLQNEYTDIATIDELRDKTTVIEFEGVKPDGTKTSGLIIQAF